MRLLQASFFQHRRRGNQTPKHKIIKKLNAQASLLLNLFIEEWD